MRKAGLLLITVLFLLTGCAKQQQPQTATVEPEETERVKNELTYPLVLKAGYSTGKEDPRGVAKYERSH